MHGFKEMANAKSCWCKFFWFMLIFTSITITAVSIYCAVDVFISEDSNVSLVRKKDNDMLYPPLKICFHHWMGWVNWAAVIDMNFTKHEVFVAMSYLTEVYSNDTFDIHEVEQSFYGKLLANNISSVDEFYKRIAYQNRKIIKVSKGSQLVPEYDIIIEHYWKDALGFPSYRLCYQFSSDQIKKILITNVEKDNNDLPINGFAIKLNLSDITANKNEILSWLTEFEYAAQVEGNLLFYRYYLPLNRMLPVKIYPDGFSKKALPLTQVHSKAGVMSADVFSRASGPCRKGYRWLTSNSTCLKKCEYTFLKKAQQIVDTSRYRAIYLVNANQPRIPLGKKEIFVQLLSAKYEGYEIQQKGRKKSDAQKHVVNLNNEAQTVAHSEQAEIQKHYEQCIKNCEREVGCELWFYSYHKAFVQMKVTANMLLIYPATVTAIEEVHVQTWENFTSNIGGLLGIFLGASFLTIFQLIHFCCSMCHKNQVATIRIN